MEHHKSTIKRIKTNNKANERNRHYRSMMKTAIKKVKTAETAEARTENLTSVCAILDRLVSKGIIHTNTAARRKSRLSGYVNSLNG